MKQRLIISIAWSCLLLVFVSIAAPINAQISTPVECGDVIESEFSERGTHDYSINISPDTILLIHAEETGDYSEITFDRLRLLDPDGDSIEDDFDYTLAEIRTPPLQASGVYTISVRNTIDDGTYTLYVDCLDSDGHLTSGSRFNYEANCGNIFEDVFPQSETRHYFISLNRGDTISIVAEETGSYSEIKFDRIRLLDPDGDSIEDDFDTTLAEITSGELPTSGIYTISVRNTGDDGTYTLYIGCVQDGETIRPGDVSVELEETIVVAGSFQSEIGCLQSQGFGGDWAAECGLSQLDDSDGDGIYTWVTNDIPEGNWEAKVAYDGSWDENYGEDGEPDGANIPFRVRRDGQQVEFSYNARTHILSIETN